MCRHAPFLITSQDEEEADTARGAMHPIAHAPAEQEPSVWVGSDVSASALKQAKQHIAGVFSQSVMI